MLRFTLKSFYLNLTINLLQIHTPLQSNQLIIMKWTISWNYYTQNMMIIFWILTFICFRIYWWLPYFKIYTVYTVFFNKYRGSNVAVTNYMSQFSMFFPTKATVKMDNGNMVHVQGIGIILCHFPKCNIIYPVGPVYYFPGCPSNTI